MADSLIAPTARARFVVTLPPSPSHVASELERLAGTAFTSLTETGDAFVHLAKRARQRLVVMTPYIDAAGAAWASELFEATTASDKQLILRGTAQLEACGMAAQRLRSVASGIHDFAFEHIGGQGERTLETFHAKIVLADGVAAYVGSANFLYRSREANLECGFMLEGDAVTPVTVLVDAVLAMFRSE